MKTGEKLCRNKCWMVLLSLAAVGGLFLYCYGKVPFMMTNDNFYLKSIVSGEMTGTPEFRMYYIGVVFGGVVSALYKLFPGGAWYGIVITASMGAALAYLLYRILEACSSLLTQMFATFSFVFLTFGFFTVHIVKSEYTTITGIVGCAALLALYLLDETRETKFYLKELIPVTLFSVWSVGMRDKAYYMLLPFIGMIFVGKLFDAYAAEKWINEKGEWREKHSGIQTEVKWGKTAKRLAGTKAAEQTKKQNLGLLCGTLAFFLFVVITVTTLAYGDSGWRTFRVYTKARERVFDYYGFPDYESHRGLYEKLGITQSSYEAVTKHYNIMLDSAINEHSMMVLAETGKQETDLVKGNLGKRIGNLVTQFWERNFTSYAERPINILVYLLYLMVLPVSLLMRKKKAVRDVAFVLVARSFLWIYLIDGGRFPTRVTQIIYTAELFMLVGIAIRYRLWKVFVVRKGDKAFPVGAVFGVVLLCAACARFGVPVARAHISEVHSWYDFSSSYRELQEYFAENSDKFYYFDMSHLYFEEEVFEQPRMVYDEALGEMAHAQHNYLYMGSWMAKSPWYDKVFDKLGITDAGEALITDDRVFLLYQEVDFDSWDFLERYYEEHYPGSELRVVDEFVTSNGTKYDIIKGFWK